MSEWIKSSFCKADSPMCVEVRDLHSTLISVHNSQDAGRELFFTRDEWRAFIEGVKAGEFDLK